MRDWRERIRQIVQGQERPGGMPDNVQEARSRISDFIGNVVIPAFEELKAEIGQLEGRTAEIRKTENQASITVLKDAAEEFSFAVRGRSYHQTTAGFPQITRDDLPMACKAEIVLYSGSQGEYSIDEFNMENIIDSFISEYEKWGRWGVSY
jgi:hypothetical protein